MNKAKRYYEKKTAKTKDQPDHIGASAGRTGNIDQMTLFAAAQNRTTRKMGSIASMKNVKKAAIGS